MQVGFTLLLLCWAAVIGSWAVAAGTASAAAFAAGFTSWHEHEQLTARYGEGWQAYRGHVRAWWPRWRPYVEAESVLYVGWGCEVCEPVARWLERRRPRGLRLVDAAEWTGDRPLRRIAYVGPDGYRADGVRAVARALEHLHLGWAWAGWLLRLPIVAQTAQVLLDATGAGPRTVNARR